MSDSQEVTVTSVINEARFSGYLWMVLTLCTLTAIFDGYDTQGIAYVAPVIAQDLGINSAALGPIFGAGLVGLMLGAIGFGMLADKIGRKQSIMWSVLVFGVFSIATPMGHSVQNLLILRFLAGIGLGGALPNIIALMLEYAPNRRRALVVNSPNACFALGSIIGGLLATVLIPAFGWQSTFYVGGALPLLFLIVIALWLPESARFLLLSGKSQEKVLGIMQRIAPERNFTASTRFTLEPQVKGITVKQLFTEGRAVVTLLLWVAFFMNLFVLLYIINWMPTLLRQAGQPLQTAIIATVWYGIGGVIGGLTMGWLADRFGDYTILAIAYVGAALFIAVDAFSTNNTAVLIPAMFFTGVSINGGQASLNTIAATYYPTAIRSTGVGWALGIGRIGSILGPVVGGILVGAQWSISSVILANIVPAIVAAIAIVILRQRQPARIAAPRPSLS
jgi:AAHS family 4-hydroxybenzoate transporter-like MFS transporter